MTRTDRSFEDRLTDALHDPMTAEQLATLDARVHRLAGSSGRRGLLGRKEVRIGVLLAAVLVVALPLMALGGVFSTEDPFGLATPEEHQAELDAAMAEVPLPDGRSWPDLPSLDTRQPDDCTDEQPQNCVGGYSRNGGRSTVELVAICIWLDEWVDATAAGDAPRVTAAGNEISRIPTWPSWDSVFFDQSVRDHLGPIIDAVAEGRVEPAQAEVASANCSWVNAQP